jgi:hypothetical protein
MPAYMKIEPNVNTDTPPILDFKAYIPNKHRPMDGTGMIAISFEAFKGTSDEDLTFNYYC